MSFCENFTPRNFLAIRSLKTHMGMADRGKVWSHRNLWVVATAETCLVSVRDPKPTPARIGFSIPARYTASDTRAGWGLGTRLKLAMTNEICTLFVDRIRCHGYISHNMFSGCQHCIIKPLIMMFQIVFLDTTRMLQHDQILSVRRVQLVRLVHS